MNPLKSEREPSQLIGTAITAEGFYLNLGTLPNLASFIKSPSCMEFSKDNMSKERND